MGGPYPPASPPHAVTFCRGLRLAHGTAEGEGVCVPVSAQPRGLQTRGTIVVATADLPRDAGVLNVFDCLRHLKTRENWSPRGRTGGSPREERAGDPPAEQTPPKRACVFLRLWSPRGFCHQPGPRGGGRHLTLACAGRSSARLTSTPESVAAERFSSRRSPFPQPHGEAVNRRPLGASVTSSSGPADPVRHAPERGARRNQRWGAGSLDSWVPRSAPPSALLPLPQDGLLPTLRPSGRCPAGLLAKLRPLPRRSRRSGRGPCAPPRPVTQGCDGHHDAPPHRLSAGPKHSFTPPSTLQAFPERSAMARPCAGHL